MKATGPLNVRGCDDSYKKRNIFSQYPVSLKTPFKGMILL